MYRRESGFSVKGSGTGDGNCRVEGLHKRPRLLEAGDHHDIWHDNCQP